MKDFPVEVEEPSSEVPRRREFLQGPRLLGKLIAESQKFQGFPKPVGYLCGRGWADLPHF
eukprot:4059143-Heterocapsa_arctica.AAC.1